MILTGTNGEKYLCSEMGEQTVRLHRVFGSVEELTVPDQIEGYRVETINTYCFAQNGHLTGAFLEEVQKNGLGDGTDAAPGSSLRPIGGSYLSRIALPDSVKVLEPYAFYNCRNLTRLELPGQLSEIGNDAFMNCTSLAELDIRADVKDKTGLMYILNQVSTEVVVRFLSADGTVCVLYPEYSESYEEIGPAHIFSLHVEGEGYRARKQFVDGVIDWNGYDLVFEKASHEEHFLTLMKMALCRLEYPYELSKEAKDRYEGYILAHDQAVFTKLAQNGDEETLKALCHMKNISDEAIESAITAAISRGWTKGVAEIIRWRNEKVRDSE